MKNIIIFFVTISLGLLTACGSTQKKDENTKMEDISSTKETPSENLKGSVNSTSMEETKQERLNDPVNADTIEVGSVEKTEAQWREILKPKEFHILREGGTEPAFVNEYFDNKTEGIYYCGACGLPVYSSKTKFHSGTGWPSFWAPIDAKLVVRRPDKRFGMERTEVVCAQCGSHFGHIFPNSTVPSGERHCLNSLALDFKPQDL